MDKKEEKELKERYNNLIKEIDITQLKSMCDNNEININAMPNKIWVVNFLGCMPEEQAEFILNLLVLNDVVYMVEIKPENLFERIYAIKDYRGQQDIIAIFQDDKANYNKMLELYPETITEFTISKYVNEQLSLQGTNNQEKYDPLGFGDQQKKIDDIASKLESGEITFGESLRELGLIGDDDYDNKKVIDIIEKLVNKKINPNGIKKMFENNEINVFELDTISKILKSKYPEINKQLNEDIL